VDRGTPGWTPLVSHCDALFHASLIERHAKGGEESEGVRAMTAETRRDVLSGRLEEEYRGYNHEINQ
jgi:hypothetical protein